MRNFPSDLRLKFQPALLVAPCFQAPVLIRPYVYPQQNLKRCILAHTSRIAPLAMISFSKDRLAGSIAERLGDVYWIYKYLPNNIEKGLIINQEISGDHYRPLERKRSCRELAELITYFLEVLKIDLDCRTSQKHSLSPSLV